MGWLDMEFTEHVVIADAAEQALLVQAIVDELVRLKVLDIQAGTATVTFTNRFGTHSRSHPMATVERGVIVIDAALGSVQYTIALRRLFLFG